MIIFKKSSFFLMLLCLLLGALYLSPKIEKKINDKKAKIVTDNCMAYSNAILGKYKANKKINIEKVAQELINDFNSKYLNPINKKEQAFTYNGKVQGACNIAYNKNVKALDVTGFDSDYGIIIRVVVKPPSFVRYDRS